MNAGLLSGVRVLDLSRVLAGPYCTAMLADFGAEVTKIEMPGHGDDARHLGPFAGGESIYFGLINRGKNSIEMDLKSDDGKTALRSMVAEADVVVENFRPGVAARLGLDYESLKAANPELIYASISGFGQEGPLSDQPAYDAVAQAMSGLMSVTGFPETGPTRSGESIADVSAGMFAAWAIASALFARERGRGGAYVDVSMFDSLLSMQVTGLSNLLATGSAPGLVGNRHPVTTPFDTFRARDGLVVIAVASDKLFARLCDCLDMPDLASDPRFDTDESRTAHEKELKRLIEVWAADRRVEEICDILLDAGVPASPVWDLQQATSHEHAAVRQVLIETSDGAVIAPQPVFVNGTKPRSAHGAPRLGDSNLKPSAQTRK